MQRKKKNKNEIKRKRRNALKSCNSWCKSPKTAIKSTEASRFKRRRKKKRAFYALLVTWRVQNARVNAFFNKMRVKNKSSRGRRDKNAIHSPILGENWRKTTRFHRFWAKICKNDAFLRLFAAFWNPEPQNLETRSTNASVSTLISPSVPTWILMTVLAYIEKIDASKRVRNHCLREGAEPLAIMIW